MYKILCKVEVTATLSLGTGMCVCVCVCVCVRACVCVCVSLCPVVSACDQCTCAHLSMWVGAKSALRTSCVQSNVGNADTQGTGAKCPLFGGVLLSVDVVYHAL